MGTGQPGHPPVHASSWPSYPDQSWPQWGPHPQVGINHHSGLRLPVTDYVSGGGLFGYSYGALVHSCSSTAGHVSQHHTYPAMDLPPFISYTGPVCPPRGESTTHANIQQRQCQASQQLRAMGSDIWSSSAGQAIPHSVPGIRQPSGTSLSAVWASTSQTKITPILGQGSGYNHSRGQPISGGSLLVPLEAMSFGVPLSQPYNLYSPCPKCPHDLHRRFPYPDPSVQ